MKGLHLNLMCACVIVAVLIAYHVGTNRATCTEHATLDEMGIRDDCFPYWNKAEADCIKDWTGGLASPPPPHLKHCPRWTCGM